MTDRGLDWDVMLALRRGLELQQRGRLDEAEGEYGKVLQAAPAHPDALHFMGLIAAERGRLNDAADLLTKSLSHSPRNPAALFNYAAVLRRLGRTQDAIAAYDRVLAIKPDHFRAIADRGSALQETGNIAQALESYDRSLALQPAQPATVYNRANVLYALNRHDDAIRGYDHAFALKPDHIDAARNRAKLLCELGRQQDALAGCDQAIIQNARNADLHAVRGDILASLERHDDALLSYGRALEIDPRHSDALIGRSEILARRLRHEEALTDLNRALSIAPGNFRGLVIRGRVLTGLQRFEDACADFERALSLRPGHPYLQGSILECKLNACDWRGIQHEKAALDAAVSAGQRAARPVVNIIASESPQSQLQCARIWMRHEFAARPAPLWSGDRYDHTRLRIGYLAPEFGFNPVATQMAGVFEHHDKSRFEITLIPFGRSHGSAIRSRIERACEHSIDIHTMSDGEAARSLRGMEMDILVDFAGLSGSNRMGVLAMRPAPIQVSYLFPGTTGADFIDYIIADRVVIPESHRSHYSENVVHLPDTFMANDSQRPIGPRPARGELGLPADGFVFCCFNNSFKYTPEVFDVWMRLLESVDKSVLWLPRFNEAVVENLKKEAEQRSVSGERLVFARFLSSPEDHLARLQAAGLFLDTLPYNAHATACDALWVGLPVVTCTGSTYAGRVGGSLLHAVGLPDLITQTLDEYEALALRLATDRSLHAHVKAELAANRPHCPLFDTARFTRNLEAAFELMVQRSRSGQSPTALAVPATG